MGGGAQFRLAASDRAGRLDVSTARVAFAAVLSGVEALINPMPIQAAAS